MSGPDDGYTAWWLVAGGLGLWCIATASPSLAFTIVFVSSTEISRDLAVHIPAPSLCSPHVLILRRLALSFLSGAGAVSSTFLWCRLGQAKHFAPGWRMTSFPAFELSHDTPEYQNDAFSHLCWSITKSRYTSSLSLSTPLPSYPFSNFYFLSKLMFISLKCFLSPWCL